MEKHTVSALILAFAALGQGLLLARAKRKKKDETAAGGPRETESGPAGGGPDSRHSR